MDHDFLMMIYGALIGVGSSVITTLFQSWIGRRERERQRAEDKKREQQKIQIPTTNEINAITSGNYPNPSMDDRSKAHLSGCLFIPIAFLGLLLCGGFIYLIYRIDNLVLYLIVSWLAGFSITFLIIKNRQI